MGKMGFSKRELSKINCEAVQEKCIEVNFEEDQYQKWIQQIVNWDQFVADNVVGAKRDDKIRAKRDSKSPSINSEPETADTKKKSRSLGWSLQQTEGEKRSGRIGKLKAAKRSEAFDEKYEESKEEREERQYIADQKRKLILEFQIEQEKIRREGKSKEDLNRNQFYNNSKQTVYPYN